MIIKTLWGLPFEVASPSYYRLLPALTGERTLIDVAYLDAGEWALFFARDGQVEHRLYPSRDDAISVLAEAYGTI